MRKMVFALMAVGLLAGCTNAEKGAVVGGVGGAAVGALVSGDAAGAAVGGLIGARRWLSDRQVGRSCGLLPLSRPERPHLRRSLLNE